jgi:hypothetical protein
MEGKKGDTTRFVNIFSFIYKNINLNKMGLYKCTMAFLPQNSGKISPDSFYDVPFPKLINVV